MGTGKGKNSGTLVCQSGEKEDGRHVSLEPCFMVLEYVLKNLAYFRYFVQACMCAFVLAALKQGFSIFSIY